MIRRLRKNNKGIALLIVMMAVTALMILVVEFVYTTRVHYTMAQNERDRLQAEYMAKSAFNIALLVIKFQKQVDAIQSRLGSNATLMSTGPIYQQIPIDSGLLRAVMAPGSAPGGGNKSAVSDQDAQQLSNFLDFSGDFSAQIADEQGKININLLSSNGSQSATTAPGMQGQGQLLPPTTSATPSPSPGASTLSQTTVNQLLALVQPQRYDYIFKGEYTREDVIYNMVDWTDSDTTRAGAKGGVEDSLYSKFNPSYRVKNAGFDSVDEVGMVAGVSQEFLAAFKDSLTIYGTTSQVNINAAEKPLLYGLVGSLINSGNENQINKIVDWIYSNRSFKNQSEFVEGLRTNFGLDSGSLNQAILNSFTFQSSVFSIVAKGTVGEPTGIGPGVSLTIRAVVSQDSGTRTGNSVTNAAASWPGGFHILYWRVE